MIKLIYWQDFLSETVDASDQVIFGGTFDPVHAGHITVIRSLLEKFKRVLIAPTSQNPWKNVGTPVELRNKMLDMVLDAEGIPVCEDPEKHGVHILNNDYEYSEDLVAQLKPSMAGKLYWAVGEDSAQSVKRWRNWSTSGIPVIVLPVVLHVHADDIRNGRANPHGAIKDFIKQNQLFESK